MGLKALVERWFKEWYQEQVEHDLDARVDERLRAWADTELADRLTAVFETRFEERFNGLPKAELKQLLDAYCEAAAEEFIKGQFDIRFDTWADTWADKNLQPRLDAHFDGRLNRHLDTMVQARVANRINDRIDQRIAQFLAMDRSRVPTHAEDIQPQTDGAEPSPPSDPGPAETLVTATELERLLRTAGIKTQRIREVLKGHEAVRGRTNRYTLGDAAALILLRGARGSRRRRGQPA